MLNRRFLYLKKKEMINCTVNLIHGKLKNIQHTVRQLVSGQKAKTVIVLLCI